MTAAAVLEDTRVVFPNRKRFTRADCEGMERAGILSERYELIDGEIILKAGQNLRHGISVMRAILWLAGVFGGERIQTQVSVDVSADAAEISVPEPDVMVLTRAATAYPTRRPSGSDVLLTVEVADSTLSGDLLVKAPIYARAGIPEHWVMDVRARRIVVHRSPDSGEYQDVQFYGENDRISPLAAPEQQIRVADLLPPEPAAADSGS